jgi:hypothetical protein
MTVFALVGSEAPAQDVTRVGHFASVRVSVATGDAHCYGHSLTLWEHRGRIIGLLDVHQGLCGDPPCGVLEDVSYHSGTGRLAFSSVVGTRFDFVGTVRRADIIGTLTGQRVRLERDRNGRESLESDRSLAGWCQFWDRVPRCGGVKELCAALGEPQ